MSITADTIVQAIHSAVVAIQQAASAGQDLAPMLRTLYNVTIKGGDVSQEDIDALRAQSDAWSSEIQTTELKPEEE